MIKIKPVLLIALNIFSFQAVASLEHIEVSQPQLEKDIACEKVGETISTCLKSISWYSSPEAYIFKFKLKGDFDAEKVEKITMLHAKQLSAFLNPLTAAFYDTSPALLDRLEQGKYRAENIIIEISVNNLKEKYSAYLYPRLINNKIHLISNFFYGEVDVYKHLKQKCESIEDIKGIEDKESYQKSCIFTNK
ncbi:hypothetical protein [Vibrio bivalvicida]|uniref:Uncharacterized protein n=1 Tax=Vibrio bivalvicida TaxID=1276888 RepID=A0A177Y059_9VIBR|nr:hypothetical protein [Vibrio bivalvicida]OAJ94242.1 hypothetical protein APB76_10525 [Vibrio bivalvicida]